MSPLELDPRFTFESFVVGPSNRLTAAAARRVAEHPGQTYNPLFIYSASGLGKTHLLTAIGHHVESIHDRFAVIYDSLEHLMDEVTAAVEAGELDVYRSRLREVGTLLLDDVQFLAGHRQAQEELLRAWDGLSARGGQVVLTSDRPPQEIDSLDERLLSRFSGGLIIDMGAPDYETRIAIVRRKAGERKHELASGVAEALARIAFSNVRELQGALNRVLAVQELEQRQVRAQEVAGLLGTASLKRGADEFGEFLSEIAGTVSEVVAETERQVAEAILRWEGAGYRTRRLESVLKGGTAPKRVEELVRRFEADAGRLETIAVEIGELDAQAPELDRTDVLKDPDRLGEAEALLSAVRERARPLPAPPEGDFDDLDEPADSLAVRAARAVAREPGRTYNPLFIHGGTAEARTALAAALANGIQDEADVRVGWVEAAVFSGELVEALEHGRLAAWRSRYRTGQALVLNEVEGLAGTERAQQELFNLFEELMRSGTQLVFTSAAPPQALEGMHPRLRSRMESGLAVELGEPGESMENGGVEVEAGAGPEDGAEPGATAPAADEEEEAAVVAERTEGEEEAGGPAGAEFTPAERNGWYVSREKVPWVWPYPGDWLIDELE